MTLGKEFAPELQEDPATTEDYKSWEQVGGYFDGDGNVGLEIVKRVLHFRIRFVDTWRPQIMSVSHFLLASGIQTGRIGIDRKTNKPNRSPAFRLEVVEVASVLRAAKAMLPYCVKKKEDLRILVEYLEDRLTGNEALQAFNDEVRSKRRRGSLRTADLPCTRAQGLRLSKLENAKKARAAYAVTVPLEIEQAIRHDYINLKLGILRLSRKYGYSQKVVRRVLKSS